ncbi:hypothetical protein C5E05_06005 [Pseudoclavibacter sp. AY1H1]|nr:hypothetical protein C5E05_06005 [Pseudoclavibacter sp. AY1H1]
MGAHLDWFERVKESELLESMTADGTPLGVLRPRWVDVVQHLEEPLLLEAATGFQERVLTQPELLSHRRLCEPVAGLVGADEQVNRERVADDLRVPHPPVAHLRELAVDRQLLAQKLSLQGFFGHYLSLDESMDAERSAGLSGQG